MMARRRPNAWLAGPIAIFLLGAAMASGVLAGSATSPRAAVAGPLAGSQGTDTALPATPSAATINGRGQFASLAVTVNQTAKLTNQAVSITWTGGTPTVSSPSRFGQQYLQIMQCWGDDDGTNPTNPGPPPEQCVQGAVAGNYGGLPVGLYPSGFALSRVISRTDWPNFDPNVGVADARTTNVWMPFRSVDGKTVDIQTDPTFNPSVRGGNFWLNPFFNQITTNEIAGASTGLDGRGAELMQVLTGVQSSGLGCGQKVQPVVGGGTKVPQCWIVVVPRGAAADEDAGTPFAALADQNGVVTSPLAPTAWANRIAIPIDFNPVDSPCVLGRDERRISGSELALAAVASWQPALCSVGSLPPFSFAPIGDATARQQLVSNAPGSPGLIAVSQPLADNSPDDPIVYAPLSVSGLVIGFNIERNPLTTAPADAQLLAGVRVADINLTPRLVAKLLTQSYKSAVSINSSPTFDWMTGNPSHLGLDPDFVRFNPEFAQLQIADSRTFSGLQLPAGNSDAAQQLWAWIFADPEAKAWLAGTPDEFGMKVNPVYSTDPALNPSGAAFGDPLPSSLPKSDPYCFQAPPRGPGNSIVPPALCGTDWMPYTRGFTDSAQITRAAADGAKIDENTFAQTSNEVWTRELPQFLGRRSMLALTDTPSAAQFGLQVASLSRAGDDGGARAFLAPTTATLTAGVAAMAPKDEPQVLQPDPTVTAPGAYPLTVLTYAATRPLSLDTSARRDFSAFIDYASTRGQVPGLEFGQLPRGYAPLPASLTAVAQAAKETITTLQAPPPTTTTTDTVSEPRGGVQRPQPSTDPGGDEEPTSATDATGPTPGPPPSTAVPSATTEPATTTTTTVLTPGVSSSSSRFAVPGLGLMALGSALGALEITKRPRRRWPDDDSGDGDLGLGLDGGEL